ncbi:MAG: threonine/serine dehydratase [Thermococcus sp.]|uniref:Threonine/serine dehydratase n=1 Tax=Thermococcus litoralis TaxID=2265 RepID=A0A7C5P1A0_THELI|nr:threonine/serine dehydratase [Thermococcus sp.]HHI00109.1 threonine/serine dehydratase [Thermococcus litoralis]
MLDVASEVLKAEKRIREYIRETPLEYSPFLSKKGNANVCLKLENFQVTGSFKIRGVFNKLLSLSEEERKKGLVTASSGNHGVAFAYATTLLGLKGIVFLPKNASQAKVQDIGQYKVELRFYGDDVAKTEEFARKFADENGMTYVPPYNDLKIIGGQGTIAIELERQLEEIDAVLVPVGGGGLISGIAGYLKEKAENVEIIGVQPENSAVMYHSIKAGRIIEMESKPTLADGTAGGIEENSITFELCKRYVDDFVLVSEKEIAGAIVLMLEKHHMLIEGAAALPVAAYLKELKRFRDKNVALVISGCRISVDTLRKILKC